MRPSTELLRTHTGNLDGETVPMTISLDDLGHVMWALTDLYGDPITATIREPASNAWDSHQEAGQGRPIEVSLPTELDPTYSVQDWGVGMSKDDLLRNASRYGWSSKRNTDDQVGLMGFGFKAPLGYCDQFVVIAIKDGIKTEALVWKADEGVNDITIASEEPTDEPSGVTVLIPVGGEGQARRSVDTFNHRARQFFQFWRGDVLVDGSPPEVIQGKWIDPDVMVHHTRSYVVMGNVPYPIETPYGGHDVVAWVSIGDVIPTPTREELRQTEKTKDTLDTLQRFVRERARQVALDKIRGAPTPTRAIEAFNEWSAYLGRKDTTRKGMELRWGKLPAMFHINGWRYNLAGETATKVDSYSNLREMLQTHWVIGHPTKTVTPSQRKKIAKWRGQQQSPPRTILLVDDLPSPWFDELEVVAWDEIDAIEIPRSPKATSVPLRINLIEDGKRLLVPDDLEGPTVVVTEREWERHSNVAAFLSTNGRTVLVVDGRSRERVKKLHEGTDLQDVLMEELKTLEDLTEEEIACLKANRTSIFKLRKRHIPELLDLEVARLVTLRHSPRVGKALGLIEMVESTHRYDGTPCLDYWTLQNYLPKLKITQAVGAVMERYPLAPSIYNEDQVLRYVNGEFLLAQHEKMLARIQGQDKT